MKRIHCSRLFTSKELKKEQCLTKKCEQYIQDYETGSTSYYRSAWWIKCGSLID